MTESILSWTEANFLMLGLLYCCFLFWCFSLAFPKYQQVDRCALWKRVGASQLESNDWQKALFPFRVSFSSCVKKRMLMARSFMWNSLAKWTHPILLGITFTHKLHTWILSCAQVWVPEQGQARSSGVRVFWACVCRRVVGWGLVVGVVQLWDQIV